MERRVGICNLERAPTIRVKCELGSEDRDARDEGEDYGPAGLEVTGAVIAIFNYSIHV